MTDYKSLPVSTQQNSESQWDNKFQATLASKDEEAVGLATRIDALKGLADGDKLYLMTIDKDCLGKKKEGRKLRDRAICNDIAYGVFAGVVPILIPFSQTYKDTVVNIVGMAVNVGQLVSIIAVSCSLLGTIVHVMQKASKQRELSVLQSQEGKEAGAELALFLARSGDYNTNLPDDVAGYKMFVEKYQAIKKRCARSNALSNITGDDTTTTPSGS
mmetsp:Transcript_10745/g.18865  ORF Transcript_10745/g.18865 Transcript_10745/m.18865 type:complete len:216 (-) Transcript_10745:183-830(-)